MQCEMTTPTILLETASMPACPKLPADRDAILKLLFGLSSIKMYDLHASSK